MSERTKQGIRKEIVACRDQMTAEDRALKSELICRSVADRFFRNEDRGGDKVIGGYAPFRSEVDLVPLLEWCWTKGLRVALPKVNVEARSMSFHEVGGLQDLTAGAYGIREPREGLAEVELARIGWLIVPGVAFDRRGGRLGYGGGYYDRLSERLRLSGAAPLRIAAAYELQLLAEVPMSDHDMRVEFLVTEQAIYSMCCTSGGS